MPGRNALSRRLLRPRRPRLADALGVVTGTDPELWRDHRGLTYAVAIDGLRVHKPPTHEFGPYPLVTLDPAEAWEALAARGVIPFAWVGEPRRTFWCRSCGGTGEPQIAEAWPRCGYCDGARELPHPASVADCVALAADPGGLLAAEALARAAWPDDADAATRWRLEPRRVALADLDVERWFRWLTSPSGATIGAAYVRARRDLVAVGYAPGGDEKADVGRRVVALLAPALPWQHAPGDARR